jgi:hypothetical protein
LAAAHIPNDLGTSEERSVSTNWSDEIYARFRKRCIESADSYTIVGAEFGISRNAAIGKARRMGIHDQRPNSRGPNGCKKPQAESRMAPAPRRRTTPFREPNLKVVHPEPTFDETAPPPDCLMVDLLDLTGDNCHWPVGGWETPQKFCGRPQGKKKQQPYCDFHHHIGTRK